MDIWMCGSGCMCACVNIYIYIERERERERVDAYVCMDVFMYGHM